MGNENGFLTDDDKAFLRGERTYEDRQSVRDKRYRVRERSKRALEEFALLGFLADGDIDSIISDVAEENQGEELKAIYDILCSFTGELDVEDEVILRRELEKWENRVYRAEVSMTGSAPTVEVYNEDEDDPQVEYEI